MAVPAGKSWRPCRPKPAGATEPMRMEQTQWRGIAVWELQSADAIEADIDDQALAAHGRVHQAGELGPAVGNHVGHVDVAESAGGVFRDIVDAAGDPGVVAQGGLAGDGHDRDAALLPAVGHGQFDDLVRGAEQQLPDVGHVGGAVAVDGDDHVAGLSGDAGGAQR